MNVSVETISDPLSKVIETFCGPVLSDHDCKIFDHCQLLGRVYSGFVDGEFICCWGLIPPTFISNQAYLWMWAPEPIKHQFVFIRRSQIQVAKMLERYERIVGHCHTTAKSSQRWLRWLGAEFDPPEGKVMAFTIRRGNG